MACSAFCSWLTGAPHHAATSKQKLTVDASRGCQGWDATENTALLYHHPVSNPSFSASVVCTSVPCALHIPLLADCCVHPPSCLLLPPSQARPFVAICPSRCHLSPSQQIATSCRAVAIASNSKSPLFHTGWLLCDLSSHHHLLMHFRLLMRRLVVVSPIAAPALLSPSC